MKATKVESHLTQVREILKLVNFYVRDREMGEVLRRCILTSSRKDLAEHGKSWDSLKWQNTQHFLESSFGVKTKIVGEQLRFLELFKTVESASFRSTHTTNPEKTKLDDAISSDWAALVALTSQRYGIKLETCCTMRQISSQQINEPDSKSRRGGDYIARRK